MAKKNLVPPPNVLQIDMNLVIYFLLFGIIGYLVYMHYFSKEVRSSRSNVMLSPITEYVSEDPGRCGMNGKTKGDPFTNPYVPPVRCDAGGLFKAPIMTNIPSNAIPVNVKTQHYSTEYSQIGILTNNNDIIPLLGRRTVTSRNKWQYYTVAGGSNGNLQTKLPVQVKGRKCSSEYGCDEINNGDEVYVEGYGKTYKATVYDNGLFSYIPF